MNHTMRKRRYTSLRSSLLILGFLAYLGGAESTRAEDLFPSPSATITSPVLPPSAGSSPANSNSTNSNSASSQDRYHSTSNLSWSLIPAGLPRSGQVGNNFLNFSENLSGNFSENLSGDMAQVPPLAPPLTPIEPSSPNNDSTPLSPNPEPSPTPSPSPSPTPSPTSSPASPSPEELLNANTPSTKIELSVTGDGRVVADGRSLLTFTGRIVNREGNLVTEPTEQIVTLTTSAGRFIGTDADLDMLGFQVMAQDGVFTVQLQAGIEAQRVRIRAAAIVQENFDPTLNSSANNPTSNSPINPSNNPLNNPNLALNNRLINREIETFTQVEFITNLRPSIATGVVDIQVGARGLNYWGSRRDFLRPDLINDNRYEIRGGAQVFATGSIGEWLFLGAVNTRRNLNERCDGTTRLYQDQQFCEQQYPVYGDSSRVDYLTPSRDSIFLRFERTSPTPGAETDYLMWGDYSTRELARSSQLFTSITRQLHGFKGNFSFGDLQVTALYSYNIQGFQRDAIVPDGTSGFYFLSRRLVIGGSENVFVETEEQNRPGTVVERRQLNRGQDYEIDYDRGTLIFRRPILALDFDPFGNTLVRRIVVTYQHESLNAGDTNLYAGRLQYNFLQGLDQTQQAFVGTTYLRENMGMQLFELFGGDFRIPLGNGQIIGEFARSRNNTIALGDLFGNAYRLEADTTITPGLAARAYYRSVTENFANNATTSFSPGQTRYGGNFSARLGSTTTLTAGIDYEANYGIAPPVRTQIFDLFNPVPETPPGARIDNTLTTFRAGIQQYFGSTQVGIDLVNRNRSDRTNLLGNGNSTQIVSRANVPITENLSFRAQNELNLGDSDRLYPNRSTLGLDWRVMQGVNVRLAHQFLDARIFGGDSLTSLDTIAESRLGENTAITSRYSVYSGVNGVIGQGAIGLNHAWVVSPGLRINATYEYIFNNLFANTGAGTQFAQPYATGQTSSSLGNFGGQSYSVGVEYNPNPEFQASARVERRTSSAGNNTVITAAAAGKVSEALTALVRYQQAGSSNQLLRIGDTASFRLGLAWRDPHDDRFNALLSYQYRSNPNTIPDDLLNGSGAGSRDHLLSIEGIYAPDWQWEFYGRYALRHSTSFLANNISTDSTVLLGQIRATYRYDYRADLAVEARWIGQPSVNFGELGLALEAGYYLSPDLRTYVGYSFGSVSDNDFSGFRSRGGIYFGVTLKVNELWDGFGRQTPQPRTTVAETPPETLDTTTVPVNESGTPISSR
ncbi:MAG: hypothetical protein HC916_11350 [Coleofasciculaceae cyanobacterium SM2_1_6]|nr:hypothetical protein [Coleofasciculaceae cyanobacterium SM2_1_6]